MGCSMSSITGQVGDQHSIRIQYPVFQKKNTTPCTHPSAPAGKNFPGRKLKMTSECPFCMKTKRVVEMCCPKQRCERKVEKSKEKKEEKSVERKDEGRQSSLAGLLVYL